MLRKMTKKTMAKMNEKELRDSLEAMSKGLSKMCNDFPIGEFEYDFMEKLSFE